MTLTLSAAGGAPAAAVTATAVVPIDCRLTDSGTHVDYYWDAPVTANYVVTKYTTCDASRNELVSSATFAPPKGVTLGLHSVTAMAFDGTNLLASDRVSYAIALPMPSPAPVSTPPPARRAQPSPSQATVPPPPADLPSPSSTPSVRPIDCATPAAAVLPSAPAGGLFMLALVALILVVGRGRRVRVAAVTALLFTTVGCAATQDLFAQPHASPGAVAGSASPAPCPSNPAAATS